MNTNTHRFEIFDANQGPKADHRGRLRRTKAVVTIAAVVLIVSGAYYLGAASVNPNRREHKLSIKSNSEATDYSRAVSPVQGRSTRLTKSPHAYVALQESTETLRSRYLGYMQRNLRRDALLVSIYPITTMKPGTNEKGKWYDAFPYESDGTATFYVIGNGCYKSYQTQFFSLHDGQQKTINALVKDSSAIKALKYDSTTVNVCFTGDYLPGCSAPMTAQKCYKVVKNYYQVKSASKGAWLRIQITNTEEPETCLDSAVEAKVMHVTRWVNW